MNSIVIPPYQYYDSDCYLNIINKDDQFRSQQARMGQFYVMLNYVTTIQEATMKFVSIASCGGVPVPQPKTTSRATSKTAITIHKPPGIIKSNPSGKKIGNRKVTTEKRCVAKAVEITALMEEDLVSRYQRLIMLCKNPSISDFLDAGFTMEEIELLELTDWFPAIEEDFLSPKIQVMKR